MSKNPAREPPLVFMKPAHSVDDATRPTPPPYTSKTKNYRHEIELVVAIGKGGHDIALSETPDRVHACAFGLDMTRRDLQPEARHTGRPWAYGRSLAKSASIGALHRVDAVDHPASAAIAPRVNGQPRQSSDMNKLIWSVAECVGYLSECKTLEPGDIIMTGTPESVNAVVAGDLMRGAIAGLGGIEVRVEGGGRHGI